MKKNLYGKDLIAVKNAYVEDEKVEQFMKMLPEPWLIVTQNIRSLQEILMRKLELKQKEKTSKASEHLE